MLSVTSTNLEYLTSHENELNDISPRMEHQQSMTRFCAMDIRVIGLGELVWDTIFYEDKDGVRFLGCRGGGSVWNLLANLAGADAHCIGIGVGGGDWKGIAATEELRQFNTDVSHIRLLSNRRTRTIFQHLVPDGHCSLSTRCMVCGRRTPAEDDLAKIGTGPYSFEIGDPLAN